MENTDLDIQTIQYLPDEDLAAMEKEIKEEGCEVTFKRKITKIYEVLAVDESHAYDLVKGREPGVYPEISDMETEWEDWGCL